MVTCGGDEVRNRVVSLGAEVWTLKANSETNMVPCEHCLRAPVVSGAVLLHTGPPCKVGKPYTLVWHC